MGLFYRFARFVLGIAMGFWHRISVEGVENIPEKGGYIICSNHRTDMDPLYLAWAVKKSQLYFMAKAELFRIPLLGLAIKMLKAFPVERGKGDTGAIDFATDVVQSGRILAMFPEGTRSRDGKLLRGKSGISVIASRTGANVLPVGIKYEEPPHFRSKIVVRYGSMISHTDLHIEGDKPSEIKEATNRIMSEIAALLEAPL